MLKGFSGPALLWNMLLTRAFDIAPESAPADGRLWRRPHSAIPMRDTRIVQVLAWRVGVCVIHHRIQRVNVAAW